MTVPDSSYSGLEDKQKQLYDIVVEHCQQWLDARGDLSYKRPTQLLLQVDGQGGTGKTYVVRLISAKLKELADTYGYKDEVIQRAALTGVTVYNINGRTLHALFRLLIKMKSYNRLTIENIRALQNHLRDVSYLIIDEKSIVSLKILYFLDRRLREIFLENADQDFGGMNVVLMGDFFQLPPVAEKLLFFTVSTKDPNISQAQRLYKRFDRTIILNIVKHQGGDDPLAVAFQQCLEYLRIDRMTKEDWRLLCT